TEVKNMVIRLLRLVLAGIFVGGIAGMIVNSVKDNNNGAVVAFGLITAVASLMLISFTYSSRQTIVRTPVDEDRARTVEGRVAGLVSEGADETEVRSLVRDAVRLGRGR
ncbi:MAG: hypothetical protein JWM47_4594, partial [Acidimicrobiales bacterium]|nr:hypothetical protein [Acidimicrobiales bacterium]